MGEGKHVCRSMPAGTPTWVRDATLNDSNKDFTVPANKRWKLLGVRVTLVATATVGNRVLTVALYPDGTNPASVAYTGNITASQTGLLAVGFDGITDDFAVTNPNANLTMYIGYFTVYLPAGAFVRVYDSATIDAAADDMTVFIEYEEVDV